MTKAMMQLEMDHKSREIQRLKTRAPITVLVTLGIVASIGYAVLSSGQAHKPAGIGWAIGGIVLSLLWGMSAQLLAEWDRAVVLRLGRFRDTKGQGFFMMIPFIDGIMRTVDMRVRTTPFFGESMLTKDTVPVQIDAISFWHVWDAKKAVMEVESYYNAIVMTIQTSLRDIVGTHTLAEILSERDKIAKSLQKVLEQKTHPWGITVNSIEIRDIEIPENLKDALSKQAQAERERQARSILGQAEMEIAEKFASASRSYEDNPIALQLRSMNIIYEGIRAGGSMMLVPCSVLDTMNLGSMAALGQAHRSGQSAKTPRAKTTPQGFLPDETNFMPESQS